MTTINKKSSILYVLVVHVLVLVYQVDSLTISPIPLRGSNQSLVGATYLGVGQLLGPEDIAYDKISGIIYTGCADGFIKKVHIGLLNIRNTHIENWVNTGGRPLGVALRLNKELIVSDAYKGLLSINKFDGAVQLLTDEAEGLKFNLTNGVDVAVNGMIYFSDASFKYGLADYELEEQQGIPHGRLMSFDPVTKKTIVLVRDLFFANGLVVTPDQNSVIFCEGNKRRCRKYHIRGPNIGTIENFIDETLPGSPVNIRYDGQGHYWIGIFKKNGTTGGLLATNLEGKPIAYYTDSNLSLTGGNKIGNDLYCCSLTYPYMIKLDLTRP